MLPNTLIAHSSVSPGLKTIAEKVFSGKRISYDDGIRLYEEGTISFLGVLANFIREKKHGNLTFFNRNFHIEPTNVCVFSCGFCSYSRTYKNREDGWELSESQMIDMVKSYDGQPVTEVHIVGGVHPRMDLAFFCSLLRKIKTHRKALHIKAFTAVELEYMFRKAKVSVREGLGMLKESGLDSLPGGGAEIFDEEVRSKICADKATASQWLEIHSTAHQLGIPSNATMLYGHTENFAHRVDHMDRLRKLQDETGGFNAFIPLKFRNKDNDMSDVKEVTMIEDLRNYAVSRIYLDNFPHIKAYWPMIGKSTAGASLSFGVDDIDGTIDDTTKIYAMAGAEDQHPRMSTAQLVDLIRHAGRKPAERDTLYNTIREYETMEEPAPASGQ